MIQIDIPMPKRCADCPCFNYDLLCCRALKQAAFSLVETDYDESRFNRCPLQEVK